MRSDFIGECARFHGLPEAVCALQFLVPSLTRDQREQAIHGPIEHVGADIEPALLERLLVDSTEELDQLPVLQHCLSRLWIESGKPGSVGTGRLLLKEEHYRAVGEIAGALSKHADDVLASMPGHERDVEQIFRALTEMDAEGRATRRALPFRQLAEETGIDQAALQPIVQRLRAEGFLVPSPADVETLGPDDRVDIAHEALIRRWYKLWGTSSQPGWIDNEVEDSQKLKVLLGLERLERNDARRYESWWAEKARTAAWAARYDADVGRVEELFRRSRQARRARVIAMGILALALIVLDVGALAWLAVTKNAALEDAYKATADVQTALGERQAALAELQVALDDAKRALEVAHAEKGRAEAAVAEYVKARAVADPNASDEAQQEVSSDLAASRQVQTQQLAVSTAAPVGFLWIGSDASPKLKAADGTPVSPSAVVPGESYLMAANLVLRSAAPDSGTYASASPIGTVATDTLVEALEKPIPYARGKVQYWLHIQVKTAAEEVDWYQAGALRQLLDRQIDAAIATMTTAYNVWPDYGAVYEVLGELKQRQPALAGGDDAAWTALYGFLLKDPKAALFVKKQPPPLLAQLTAAAPTARAPDNGRFTLFIHGGGEAADTIDVVERSLQQKGYAVRAPDDQRDAVGGPGVDYFSDGDKAAAQEVAVAINALLPSGHPPLKPRRQKVKNPAGYLGVWLSE
jgi:tetratricopeptide (TPR) repeat protein